MEEAIKRLASWFSKKPQAPEAVQIYPTNKCNLRCIFCFQQLQEYNLTDTVKRRRWFEITKELCELGVKKILISGGGEPLCKSKLTLGIMKIVKHYGLKGRIINNGTLWTKKLVNETIKIGWDNIIFSIDGANPITHNYLKGKRKAFNRIIDNIKLFNKYKDRPSLEFTTVLNIYNYKEIPEIIKLASDLKIKSIIVEPVCVNNPNVEKIKLNQKQRKYFQEKIIPKSQKLATSLNINTNFPKFSKLEFEKTGKLRNTILKNTSNDFLNLPCYEPWIWPKIEANGEVWPCSTVPIRSENIKHKTFKEIWYGSEFNKFRERIMNHDLPEKCENCVSTHLPINQEIREKLQEY